MGARPWFDWLMARYHYETRRDAERKYPHRVDIPVPPMGLGKQLDDMIEWCGERFTDWTHAGITDKSRRDAQGIPMNFARFYFMDEAAAEEFRARWLP
jgi:hypothetical protein